MTKVSNNSIPNRRDFLVRSAVTFAAAGCLAVLWPFVDQMNPNRSSVRDTVDVDLSDIQLGQLKQVQWKGEPIFIRQRTQDEVELARKVLLTDLVDPDARAHGPGEKASASDANRTKAGHSNWLGVIGVCPYCRCLVKPANPRITPFALCADAAFLCPFCASRFDLAGRAKSGPARKNLAVPPYQFLTPIKIQIG
jgi:ubiquinol-cytochrome c reductase iron-sulfur subunit